MTADKRGQGGGRIPILIGAGLLAFLLLKCATPKAPAPATVGDEYTFQPEPRPAKPTPPSRLDLGASSGALGGGGGGASSPALETANCESLQQFANFEYNKRYREGKIADEITFSGFETAEVFVSDGDTLNCGGGEYLRTGKSGERRCRNVILSYDTGSNSLTYNVQYVYLERGLQPQCSGPS